MIIYVKFIRKPEERELIPGINKQKKKKKNDEDELLANDQRKMEMTDLKKDN